jgi:ABC-2 type transport system ATP-binding protein
MIEVSHLTKTYGSHAAVRDISFQVGRGEVVGFLGPNGAGKSTTLRILAGYLGMTSGHVRIAGHDVVEEHVQARASLGYMPEAVPLYGEMRVEEYLKFRAELKGVPRRERLHHVDRAMREARVDDVASTLIGTLSKGYKQRVGLADALVARPPILVLDEPTAGLDPNQIREVRALVRELGERHTVLVSTHILSEVEAICTRAIVIAKGKLVGEGTLEQLRGMRRSSRARVVVRGEGGEKGALTVLKAVPRVSKVSASSDEAGLVTLEVVWKKGETETGTALEDVVAVLVEKGFRIREASPAKATLDEVFAQLTEDEPVPPEGDDEPEKGAAS